MNPNEENGGYKMGQTQNRNLSKVCMCCVCVWEKLKGTEQWGRGLKSAFERSSGVKDQG